MEQSSGLGKVLPFEIYCMHFCLFGAPTNSLESILYDPDRFDFCTWTSGTFGDQRFTTEPLQFVRLAPVIAANT